MNGLIALGALTVLVRAQCDEFDYRTNVGQFGQTCTDLTSQHTCTDSYVHTLNATRHRLLRRCIWSGSSCTLESAQRHCENELPPNFVYAMSDDQGWDNVGFRRRPAGSPANPTRTPVLDKLATEGVVLNRMYSFPICTPARVSTLTGRLPVHVLDSYSPSCDPYGTTPTSMTMFAEKLRDVGGYMTHFVGKWDAGMRDYRETPSPKGYDSFYGLFGKSSWPYTKRVVNKHTTWDNPYVKDFWDGNAPVPLSDTDNDKDQEEYFRDRMVQLLRDHDASRPLYLHYGSRLPHAPIHADNDYVRRIPSGYMQNRRVYLGMVSQFDDVLGDVVSGLRARNMWQNTVFVFSSDNGGITRNPGTCYYDVSNNVPTDDRGHGWFCQGEAGANNWPLKGGKYTFFEGGIRVPALVSGGFLPSAVYGTENWNMMHVVDWYTTFVRLAGVTEVDQRAANARTFPVDGVDLWPAITEGAVVRDEYHVSINILIQGKWKFFRSGASYPGFGAASPEYPNTTATNVYDIYLNCPSKQHGCLFDVENDKEESREVCRQNPSVCMAMRDQLVSLESSVERFPHGSSAGCRAEAKTTWNGFMGPIRNFPTRFPPRPPPPPGGATRPPPPPHPSPPAHQVDLTEFQTACHRLANTYYRNTREYSPPQWCNSHQSRKNKAWCERHYFSVNLDFAVDIYPCEHKNGRCVGASTPIKCELPQCENIQHMVRIEDASQCTSFGRNQQYCNQHYAVESGNEIRVCIGSNFGCAPAPNTFECLSGVCDIIHNMEDLREKGQWCNSDVQRQIDKNKCEASYVRVDRAANVFDDIILCKYREASLQCVFDDTSHRCEKPTTATSIAGLAHGTGDDDNFNSVLFTVILLYALLALVFAYIVVKISQKS